MVSSCWLSIENRGMEDEREEFVGEGIDLDCEFDAPRFCDFTRPETYWEAVEAEQWFESVASYPPSPFVLKFGWGNATTMETVDASTQYGDGQSLNMIDDDSGPTFCNHTIHDILKVKTKSLSKSTRSRSSNLMKPTASHLAKQMNPREVHTTRFFRRFQIQNHNSSPIEGQATKRQKLEAGYLRKASHLKHQALFTHKIHKKVDLTDEKLMSRVTIPKPPELETAHRAQRHKSRTNAESSGYTTSSSHMFKARPLNRKILEAPSLPFRKKRMPQLPEFNVFHLRTSERAIKHTFSNEAEGIIDCNSISNSYTRDLRRPNSTDASRQEKCRMVEGERSVFQDIRQENELKFTNDKKFPNKPPTELFSKLSLASEPKQTTKSQLKERPTSKGLKENRPESFDQEHRSMNLVKEGMQRLCGKQYQCVNDRGIPDTKSHLHVGRRMDIC